MPLSLPATVLAMIYLFRVACAAAIPDSVDCRTIRAGILSANASGVLKSFYLNDVGQVAFTGNAMYNGAHTPLVVQFQGCQSLGVNTGRLYVPSKRRCVGATNTAKTAAPYYTTLVKCGTGVSQRFKLAKESIYWIGGTSSQSLQGGCGALGYKSNKAGYPNILHTRSQITLECQEMSPFHLSDTAL